MHRSSSNSSSAWITRAYTLQPKSLKSITTRHDGTKRNTRNTTQNAIHANRDACKIDHDTSRFRWFCCSVGSVGFRWVPLFRWIPLFLWVPFFLWVPLGSVVSVSPVAPLVPLGSVGFRCSVGFRVPLGSDGFRCSVGSFVPLVSVGFRCSVGSVGFCCFRWFRCVPLFCSYKSIPTRHDGNTAQHNTIKQLKTKRSAAEAVAYK